MDSSQGEMRELEATVESLQWKLRTMIEEKSEYETIHKQWLLQLKVTNERQRREIQSLRKKLKYEDFQEVQETPKDIWESQGEKLQTSDKIVDHLEVVDSKTKTKQTDDETTSLEIWNEIEIQQIEHERQREEWNTEKCKLIEAHSIAMEEKEKTIKVIKSQYESLKQQIHNESKGKSVCTSVINVKEEQSDFEQKLVSKQEGADLDEESITNTEILSLRQNNQELKAMTTSLLKKVGLVLDSRSNSNSVSLEMVHDSTEIIIAQEERTEDLNQNEKDMQHKLLMMDAKIQELKLTLEQERKRMKTAQSMDPSTDISIQNSYELRSNTKRKKHRKKRSSLMRRLEAADNDRVQCPHCNRKFHRRFAADHIQCCVRRPKKNEEEGIPRIALWTVDYDGDASFSL